MAINIIMTQKVASYFFNNLFHLFCAGLLVATTYLIQVAAYNNVTNSKLVGPATAVEAVTTLDGSKYTRWPISQPDSYYIRFMTASVLKSTTLSTPGEHWLICAW